MKIDREIISHSYERKKKQKTSFFQSTKKVV
jgi:hypothetical protein